MKKIILLSSLLVLVPCMLHAEESPVLALDLNQTLALAKQRNIEVLLAGERTRQAVERLGQAVSYLLPDVTGDISQTRQTRNLKAFGINLPQAPDIVGPFNSLDARLSVTQSLFDPEALARLRSASLGKKIYKAQEEKTKQDVLAFAANLFIEAKRAQEKVLVAKTALHRDREELKVITARKELGTATELEVLGSRGRYHQSQYIYQNARAQEEEKRLDLLAALGYPATQTIQLVDQKLADFPFSPEDTDAALKAHPETAVAAELLKQRKSDHWAELFKSFPKISAMADYGASGSTPSDSSDTYTIGLKASVPLFEGGRHFFRTRETKSLIRQSELQKADTQIRLEDRVLDAFQQVHNSQAMMRATEAQLLTLKKQSELSRLDWKQGSASHLSYIETQALRASVQDEHQEALALYSMAQVNLAHALGKMDYFLEQNTVEKSSS